MGIFKVAASAVFLRRLRPIGGMKKCIGKPHQDMSPGTACHAERNHARLIDEAPARRLRLKTHVRTGERPRIQVGPVIDIHLNLQLMCASGARASSGLVADDVLPQ
jgi:hypothetical protein